MVNWRDKILREFAPHASKLTLVADPDGILLEEGILEGIQERGFELILFDDHVTFRYAYESNYRSRWDCGEDTDLVVVLRSSESNLGSLPFDLLQAGRKLSFNLGDIFTNLSYPIVNELDRGDLDRLYEAITRHRPGQLGDNATKEFVLRHVFEVAPELINQESDLLRALLRCHCREHHMPKSLDERFVEVLRQNGRFKDWALEDIVPDREFFLGFLQERWPHFLIRQSSEDRRMVREPSGDFSLKYPGPLDLPFDHHDVRVYVENLFLEGLLQPVQCEDAPTLSKTWVTAGVKTNSKDDVAQRLEDLAVYVEQSIPNDDARYDDWLHCARAWAELLAFKHGNEAITASVAQKIRTIQFKLNMVFQAWLMKRYSGLINLPPVPPVMLHHLPKYVARHIVDDKSHKAAVIVVDGLSFDQWIVLRATLSDGDHDCLLREHALFAWIPTLTSVSRQAIFSGRAPIFFPKTIHTTNAEPALWSQFWMNEGINQDEVAYVKRLGDGPLEEVEEILSRPRTRIIGLVVDKVDRIMHGMELGSAGMHNQVQQWSQQMFMRNLVQLLLSAGYRIYLTSDHGNIEARGCGCPGEGAVADLRGQRVRVYSDRLLRRQVKERFTDACEWCSAGLPNDYLPLLAPPCSAFVRESERIVGHGGIALEEVIVPFIEIERKKK